MRIKHFATLIGVVAFASFVLVNFGEPSFADVQENAPVENDAVEQLLEAVGTMGGVQLYQTYLNIGFIADGKGQEVYSDDDAQEILTSIVGPLDRVTKQFNDLKKIATDNDDKKALDRLAKIAGMLKTQAASLESLWASGSDADGDRFEKHRQQSWNEISDFLRLDAPSPQVGPELAPAPEKISK